MKPLKPIIFVFFAAFLAYGYSISGTMNAGETGKNGVITVVSPNGGETLRAGSEEVITWSSSNISGNLVILLYKKGILVSTISEKADNTGNFRWKISTGAAKGNDYRIRIRSLDNLAINDFSDSDFSIQ